MRQEIPLSKSVVLFGACCRWQSPLIIKPILMYTHPLQNVFNSPSETSLLTPHACGSSWSIEVCILHSVTLRGCPGNNRCAVRGPHYILCTSILKQCTVYVKQILANLLNLLSGGRSLPKSPGWIRFLTLSFLYPTDTPEGSIGPRTVFRDVGGWVSNSLRLRWETESLCFQNLKFHI